MEKIEEQIRVSKELAKMTLMHDILMTRVFNKDKALVQYVLSIILNRKDLTVLETEVQKELFTNREGKSIRLDIFAKDNENTYYDIEIQRIQDNFSFKRMYYYQSIIAANTLHPGDDYNKLPKTILIFILGYDHFKDGLPYHHFTIHDETSNKIHNEATEWYILNQKYVDTTTDFGKLMHDLGCPKPNEMFLPPIKDRVEYYKEGAMSMSVKDDIREMFKEEIEQAEEEGFKRGKEEGKEEGKKEGREEGTLNNRKETVLKLLKKGYSLEEIADLLDIPLDEVKAIKE